MRSDTNKALRFLGSWIINTVAVAMTVMILRDHITYGGKIQNLLFASLLLGILNAFVRPILMLIALPLLIFTLGLFTFVINGLLLYFVGFLLRPNFQVDTFGYAFLGALIISIISLALNFMTGNSRVSIKRRPPPGPPRGPGGAGGGNGPVIDV
jgi:putative membrane protein